MSSVCIKGLALRDSSCRAYTCACTTLYASALVDIVLCITLRNSAYGALGLTCTTRNTRITDYISHNNYLLKIKYFQNTIDIAIL